MASRGGFTLIEMLVVILLLGIVAAVVAVNIGDEAGRAKTSLTKTLIKNVKTNVELFKVDHNRFPERLGDLAERPAYVEARDWHPYFDELPVDAWGRPFHYQVPGIRGPFDIVSFDEDGLPGGEGVNADLWSHPPRN